MDAAEETDHIVATYREIAAHFGLKGVAQARGKAKRAGWPAAAQNHPADPLRIRVPRSAWNAGSRRETESLPRPARNSRILPAHTPDLRDEIGSIIKGFEAALETLRQQQAALHEQLERERERADRAEQAEAACRRAEAEVDAWTAGGPFARALRAFLSRRSKPQHDRILLAKSPGYMTAHTAAGNRVAIITQNRAKWAERSQFSQLWVHIARIVVVPS